MRRFWGSGFLGRAISNDDTALNEYGGLNWHCRMLAE